MNVSSIPLQAKFIAFADLIASGNHDVIQYSECKNFFLKLRWLFSILWGYTLVWTLSMGSQVIPFIEQEFKKYQSLKSTNLLPSLVSI